MTKVNEDIPNNGDKRYVAGDTAVLEVTIKKSNGTPKDVSGAYVEFALSEIVGSSALIAKDSTNTDVKITDAANGKIEIRIDGDETVGMGNSTGKEYHYEIELRDATGDVATVTTGKWEIYANSI